MDINNVVTTSKRRRVLAEMAIIKVHTRFFKIIFNVRLRIYVRCVYMFFYKHEVDGGLKLKEPIQLTGYTLFR